MRGFGWWNNEQARSLLMVNLAAIMERADEALLPGVYREIGLALHASPARLGSLTLVRSLMQALCAPLAAYVAVHHNRANVIALGAILWSIATFFVGISATFGQVAISRALNGVGLAMVVPAIQSLVADSTEEHKRGVAFGWLQLTGNVGSVLGGLCSIMLAGTSWMGYPGWRLSFHLVAIVSIVVALLVHAFAIDPRFPTGHTPPMRKRKSVLSGMWQDLKEMLLQAKQVVQIQTFQILVAQGVAGSFPWAALAFAPMWLELIGFSHAVTAILLFIFTVATSLGAVFGGKMGDILSIRLPNAGRIILSQISSGLGVPLAAVLFLVLHDNAQTAVAHGFVFFILGFFTSWNAAATNNPIFAEIVPVEARTNVYALDRSFETVLASFAPPIVGLLAEKWYGYIPPQRDADQDTKLEVDRENAVSLSKALYTSMGIPLFVCCLIYTLLYWTYPRDRDHALFESQIGKETGTHHRLEVFNGKDGGIAVLQEEDEEKDEGSGYMESSTETECMLPELQEI